ncbi:MAG: quinolinate synthase NadA, partial [Gemmatimonadota bacterium]
GVPVVTYINTYADVKAESDVCCTSSNAARVVESLDSDTVIFIPDEYLARNVARETGKRILVPSVGAARAPVQISASGGNGASGGGTTTADPAGGAAESGTAGTPTDPSDQPDGELIGWPGRCEVHEQFTVGDIENVRRQFPDVVVLAHPECSPEVVDAADYSGSTSAMIRYVQDVEAPRYLLLTECSMGDNIVAETPDREMVRLCSVRCPHMNEITLEQTLAALREDKYVIEVPEDVRVRALRSIRRMLEIG